MCTRGVWQLQSLTLRYCKHSGSSAGLREYLREGVIDFARANPQVEIRAINHQNRHPIAVGEYLNGNSKTEDLKSKSAAHIADIVQRLRDTSGRKIKAHEEPVRSEVPSVQGVWHPSTRYDEFELDVPSQ